MLDADPAKTEQEPSPPAEEWLLERARGDDLVHGKGNGTDKPSTNAKRNIEHFQRLLGSETDPVRREIIACLLAEQQAKLLELEGREARKP